MRRRTTAAHVEQFRQLIRRRLGLEMDLAHAPALDEVLYRRMGSTGHREADGYLRSVNAHELRRIAEEVTVNETYFLRDRGHFQVLAEEIVPSRAHARTLRILSAGCASGEEPYSIAIVLREILPDIASWDISIRGIDVNPAKLEHAARGRYGPWALRDTPPEIVERHFRRAGSDFEVHEAVRGMVTFDEQNLVDDDGRSWWPRTWDVVFCRNVLMYLSPEVARGVVARAALALDRGGVLFTGHAETLRGLSEKFDLRERGGTFYYRLREDGACARNERRREDSASSAARPPHPLSPPPVRIDARVGEGPRPGNGSRLELVVELMRYERYQEALQAVRGIAPADGDACEPRVLEALLSAHAGNLQHAASVCAEVLGRDPLNAQAHHVLALSLEQSGDRDQAAQRHRTAAFLDPSFAMPRLRLGLLARRAGDEAGARRELARALILLEQEDPARIALFGGGFGRAALMALCRGGAR